MITQVIVSPITSNHHGERRQMAKRNEVSFFCPAADRKAARAIGRRARTMLLDYRVDRSALDIEMDVLATHCNGNPLRLNDLLKADDFNFLHDISGIARHLNRNTGKLKNLFSPRFSARKSEAA